MTRSIYMPPFWGTWVKKIDLWQKTVVCVEFVKKTEGRKKFKGSTVVAKFARCEFSFAANQPIFVLPG